MSEEAATDLTRVIEKIRKLLALATSANEHEATAALAQAQKLMDAHRISMDAVEGAGGGAEPIEIDTEPLIAPAGKHARWKTQLFALIAEHNGCRSLLSPRRVFVKGVLKWQSAFVSVGRESDRLMTRFMVEFCVRAVDNLTTRSEFKSSRERNAYRWGVVVAIGRTLEASRKQEDQLRQHMAGSRAALRSNNSALAIVDRRVSEVDAQLAKRKDVEKARTPKNFTENMDYLAMSRGISDGKSVRMPAKPLSSSEKVAEIAEESQ